jgi:hypothetical protein
MLPVKKGGNHSEKSSMKMKGKATKRNRFYSDKRAVSSAISDVIMACAIIAVGFSLLFWTGIKSGDFNLQYSSSIDTNLAKIREKLAFECIFYNTTGCELHVFLLNCGKSHNVSLTTFSISNSSWSQSFSNITLSYFNGTIIPNMDVSEEGFFALHIVLEVGKVYSIQLETYRGRFFDTTFIA